MFRRGRGWLLTASLGTAGCSLWPTADIDCLASGRCTGPSSPDNVPTLVLGQSDAFSNRQLALGVDKPTSATKIDERFVVVDSGNHRVLIWNGVPSSPRPADVVLGQPDLTTNYSNTPTLGPSSLNRPHSVATDGTRLFVADSGNRRVLIWNQLPTRNAQPADLVIGQPDFTSSGAGLSASALGDNPDVAFAQKFMVTDKGNSRVLIWNQVPTANFAPASVVVGQANKTSGLPNRGSSTLSASSLSSPSGPASLANQSLVIADSGNNRVLVYNPIPQSDGATASLVLGQANFASGQVNGASGTISASGFSNPLAASGLAGGRLFVADAGNNRVLSFAPSVTSGGASELVIGQPSFVVGTPNAGGISATSLTAVEGITLYSGSQEGYLADSGNNRVLYIPDVHPTSPGTTTATVVVGQPSFTSSLSNNPIAMGGNIFGSPSSVSSGGGRLAVSDGRNHRVLLWNSAPRNATDLPSLALGQPDFVSTAAYHGGTTSGDGFEQPFGVWTDGDRLLVADANRVLVWKSWPTTSLQRADFALGQDDLRSNKPNQGGVSAISMAQVSSVFVQGERVYVTDGYNHRVLIFNKFPTKSGAPADLVLGQPDMVSNSSNAGSLPCLGRTGTATASQVFCPQGVAVSASQLVVASFGDSRVLIWNRPITANNQPADIVLGQSDFTQLALPPGPTSSALLNPVGVALLDERLYVSDFAFNRVLFWNAPPTQSNQPADGVVGQPDLTGGLPNSGGLTASRLSGPLGIDGTADMLYIVDSHNFRVLARPHP